MQPIRWMGILGLLGILVLLLALIRTKYLFPSSGLNSAGADFIFHRHGILRDPTTGRRASSEAGDTGAVDSLPLALGVAHTANKLIAFHSMIERVEKSISLKHKQQDKNTDNSRNLSMTAQNSSQSSGELNASMTTTTSTADATKKPIPDFVVPQRLQPIRKVTSKDNKAVDVLHGNFEDSIFVSIASYRDEECAPTILDMYEKAKNPLRIFVGAVEQHFPSDKSCIPEQYQNCQNYKGFCPSDQILVRRINPADAKGPTFGRYIGMYMYRGEKYIFMMDSHNRFVTHWDDILVRVYKQLPTTKGVLSHYPEAWQNPLDGGPTNAPLDNRKTTTYLCNAKFIGEGFIRLDGFVVHRTTKSRPQPFAAAGFLFADAQLLREVPFDPNLPYVFDGEEILYSVRMWTHGWDIFSPSENTMYHYYYRAKAKKFWGLLPAGWNVVRDRAVRRIQYLLNVTKPGTMEPLIPPDTKEEWILKDLDKFGMGHVRTVEEWYKYAGVDRQKRTFDNRWCPRA